MICGPRSAMRAGDGGEHRERREAHHIIGDLEHHLDQRLDAADDRLPLLADAVSATPKKIEKMTIGRISLVLIASKIDCGTRWVTKSLRLNAAVCDAARGGRRRERQVEADARVEQSDEDQAERQRHEAGEDEPAERAHADAAERGDVAHVRDAGDQRREDQRRDDHLDQAQEQRGDDAEIVGDRLQPRGACRRAVVDRGS